MLEIALRHRFPAFELDVALSGTTPGTMVLFGPSGSGKSTIVAAVAGLLRPDRGRVVVDGTVLADSDTGTWIAAERRRIGVVFQEPRLFPHLRVESNLRYGQRRAIGTAGPSLDDVVALLGIGPLLRRRPHTLSGGERQRVAIGRALLSRPRLLLMDEPLANLDAARRDEILPYLMRLRAALALPIVYVTHALDEVVRLADTLVLLDQGHVTASGGLADLTARGDLPLAARDDAGTVLAAVVVGHDGPRRLTRLSCGDVTLDVPIVSRPPGTALRIRIPAREVILATEIPRGISIHNAIAGRVRTVTDDAARHAALVEIATAEVALLARVTPDAVERLGLVPGAAVIALVKSVAIDVVAG